MEWNGKAEWNDRMGFVFNWEEGVGVIHYLH